IYLIITLKALPSYWAITHCLTVLNKYNKVIKTKLMEVSMIIPTVVAEDIEAQAIKSGRPEEFLAGVIIVCQITGVGTENLTAFLKKSKMTNFKNVEKIVNRIKGGIKYSKNK
ncbi:MAG TPA: hypothetical protein PLD95_03730, partial [bacterium]|nr:hypothetical protein [bacterium]HOG38553.1 hypothetical protein [bacterium]HQI03423.1 hypothetical protein [bacterium]